MKKMNAALLISAFTLTLAACSNNTPTDPQNVVDEANTGWNEAFNDGNAEQLSGMYSEQATVSAGDGKVLAGRVQIQDLFQSYFDSGLHNHNIESVATYAAEGQISQLANWSADVENEQGEIVTYKGVLMTVLQQDGQGDWQVVSHLWNMAQ